MGALTSRRPGRLVAVGLVAALTLAACSGDDDASEEDSAEEVEALRQRLRLLEQQVDELARLPLATRKIDFFGVHLGFLYSTDEVHPDRQTESDKEGLGISVAIGIRYAHGRGDTLGLLVPGQYDPSLIRTCTNPSQPDNCIPVATKVNEIGINLGAKVAF